MQRTYERETPPWEREEPKFTSRRDYEDDYYGEAPRARARILPRIDNNDYEDAPPRKTVRKPKESAFFTFLKVKPLESVAFGAAAFFCLSIMINAVFLQNKPVNIAAATPQPISTPSAFKPTLPVENRFLDKPAFVDAQPIMKAKVNQIEEVQRELARRGFYVDTIDGKPGSRTDKAVKEFQRSIGVKATGEINDDLFYALRPSADKSKTAGGAVMPSRSAISELVEALPSKNDEAVTTASTKPSVRRIYLVEKTLADMGYGPLTVDGLFDDKTKQAIIKFEQARQMRPRGEINDRLIKELVAVTGTPLE